MLVETFLRATKSFENIVANTAAQNFVSSATVFAPHSFQSETSVTCIENDIKQILVDLQIV